MNNYNLRLFLFANLVPILTYAQEIPDPLVPTERVTYGTNEHTSRDAIFFSEKDSRGNLIVAGYTERDFTFSDIKIVSLNENLEEIWSDRLSWDGLSYDYPIDLMIDEEDHVWVISKNYVGGTRANYIIDRYSPSGEKLWEYKSPETVDHSTLNMNQYYYYFDKEGYLNFTYQKEQEFDTNRYFFKISPTGVVSKEYLVKGPFSKLSHFDNDYLGFSLKIEGETQKLYYRRFNQNEAHEKILDFTSLQLSRIRNSLFEPNTQSFTDKDGNYIYVGDGNFHDNTGYLHPGLIIVSISDKDEINFFLDDDGNTDTYLLDVRINELNEILVLSNTQPITDNEKEPTLSLDKYSKNGVLLFRKNIENVTGNIGKIEENEILIRTLNGKLQNYDLNLNLLQSYEESATESYFNPQDIHSANAHTYLVGTTISKRYEGSDYNSEENFLVKKFTEEGLASKYRYDGEGTSKYYNYHMIQNSSGDFLISCREIYGPNNHSKGGSKAPYLKKVLRFNSNLVYQDQEVVNEEFDLWEKPTYSFNTENGDNYLYEIDEERKKVNFYRNGELTWTRNLNFGGNNYMKAGYNNVVDKAGNFIVFSSLYGNYSGKIHLLSPENDYNVIDTGVPVSNATILSNNWIFTILDDYSVRIYSKELELISERQYEENYFFGENYFELIEKNNKILLNVRHKNLVMVFDQFGDYQSRFTLEGLLHASVAIFDKNDALNVYHTIGQGIYTEHGHNWTRLAISRYENVVEDYIGKLPDGDQDGDGVSDFIDRCPSTSPDSTVDKYGCAIKKLASDNLKLTTKDETCEGKNNGQFLINVIEEQNYILTLNDEEHEFNLGMSFEALSPGIYKACIRVKNQPQSKKCFEFEIKAGETLLAESSVQDKTMFIEVKKGSAPFNVKINGIDSRLFHTRNFNIPVEDGDIVEVSSSTQCEGKISMFAIVNTVRLSANPVDDFAEINTPHTDLKIINVKVFNSSSHLMFSKNLNASLDQKLKVPTASLPAGIYYLLVQLEKLYSLKLIKR